MILRLLVLAVAVCVTACQRDETAAAYGASDDTWRLTEIAGIAFTVSATMEIAEGGAITGQGPCNRYSGSSTVPYPWFALDQIASTKVACPDLEAEARYFEALKSMIEIEVLGPVLILRNDVGAEMVFNAVE